MNILIHLDEKNEWFLKQEQLISYTDSHMMPINTHTYTPQNHLLHPHSPKPPPNCSTRSTHNAPAA